MLCPMRFLLCLMVLVGVARAGDPAGTIVLPARDATLEAGDGTMQFHGKERGVIGHWNSTNSVAAWKVTVPAKATYRVILTIACDVTNAGSEVSVEMGGQRATGVVPDTGGWGVMKDQDLGPVLLRKPGEYELTVRATKRPHSAVMNLKAVKLVPE